MKDSSVLDETFKKEVERGCDAIIFNCALLQSNESVLIISDSETKKLGDLLANSAADVASRVEHLTLPPFTMHGQSPPDQVGEKMLMYDVVCGITKFSLAHSQARLQATKRGAKYVSLPDYSLELLADPALTMDFPSLVDLSTSLASKFTDSNTIRVTTRAGTDLLLNVEGRVGNAAPGCCFDRGIISSPPDAETNISIVEDSADGVLVVDGSIPCPEIGLLESPITLYFRNGYVEDIEGNISATLTDLFDSLGNRNTRIAAEFGVGLNPKAKLCGKMLPDEGALGTFHIGMGANATIGGQNSVPFHLDHVVRDPTIQVDDLLIASDGKILIPQRG